MRLAFVFALAALLLVPTGTGEIDPYVSQPRNVPDLHNFTTPQIHAGESGVFSLNLTNRYLGEINNTTITIAIYMRADITGAQPIAEIPASQRPAITEGCWETLPDGGPICPAIDPDQNLTLTPGTLAANETVNFRYNFTTTPTAPVGTYFVRSALEFRYNDSARVMKSRGHWTAEEWQNAVTDVPPGSPGNLNLTALGVDGIIPDSSFGVVDYEEVNRLLPASGVAVVALSLAAACVHRRDSRRRRAR